MCARSWHYGGAGQIMLYLICLLQFQNSYYFKMISCEYNAYDYNINNLYSVLISYLNSNTFVVLGKPL
mgnify:FL=1